jgi:hypothetical protein
VQVGVADAAEEDIDNDLGSERLASGKVVRSERSGAAEGGVTFGG